MQRRITARPTFPALLLVALAASLLAVPQLFADEWSKTYAISGKPDLRIETSDANIRVTTWDQNTIAAKVVTTRYKISADEIRIAESSSEWLSTMTMSSSDIPTASMEATQRIVRSGVR